MKLSKNNLHHLFHPFRSIFIFSSVVYLQYTPSSKRNLYSKIIDKSDAVYFFHVSIFVFPKGNKCHSAPKILQKLFLLKYSVFIKIVV